MTLRALAPCQSLGAFYISPTPASQRFLEALTHWIMYTWALLGPQFAGCPSALLCLSAALIYPHLQGH